jgi:hypothetical protein
MVTIRRYSTQGDALSAVVTLQSENIEAIILHENAIPSASGSIELQVAESDAATASKILNRRSGTLTRDSQIPGIVRGALAGIGYTIMVGIVVFVTGGQFQVTGFGVVALIVLGGIVGMNCWAPIAQSDHDEPEEKAPPKTK